MLVCVTLRNKQNQHIIFVDFLHVSNIFSIILLPEKVKERKHCHFDITLKTFQVTCQVLHVSSHVLKEL